MVNTLNYDVKIIDFGQVIIKDEFSKYSEDDELNAVFENENRCNPTYPLSKFQAHHKIWNLCNEKI